MDKAYKEESSSPEKDNIPILYSIVNLKNHHGKKITHTELTRQFTGTNPKWSGVPSSVVAGCSATTSEQSRVQIPLVNPLSSKCSSSMNANCSAAQSTPKKGLLHFEIPFSVSPGPATSSTIDSPNKNRRTPRKPLFSHQNLNTPSNVCENNPCSTPSVPPGSSRTKGQGCVGGVKMPISGVDVEFPFQPYPTQIYMMSQVLQAIKKADNCLLESPTGTGKTMALLCSCLAWQQQEKRLSKELEKEALHMKPLETLVAEVQESGQENATKNLPTKGMPVTQEIKTRNSSSITSDDSWSDDEDNDIFQTSLSADKPNCIPTEAEENKASKGLPKISLTEKVEEERQSCDIDQNLKYPQIFYGTRTHKQVAQVVEQLKRSAYAKDVKMTILAARDHTCVNNMVQGNPNVTELCKAVLDPITGGGCVYYNGLTKTAHFEYFSNNGLPMVYDIEDMVHFGRKRKICPYFTLRNLASHADIIFCPYNYLIDPRIRGSMNVNLKKSIVIMDEAHNIEDICREAGSLLLKQTDLEEAINECKENIYKKISALQYKEIEDFLQSLHSWLDLQGPNVQYSDVSEAKTTMSGTELVNRLHVSGITQEKFHIFKEQLLTIEKAKIEEPEENYGVTGKVKQIGGDIQLGLTYLFNPKNMSKYQAYLSREIGSKEMSQHRKSEWLTKPSWRMGRADKGEDRVWKYSLHLVCLSPAIVFSELLGARTIVLASGTLSPLDSFQAELSVKFPWVVKGRHVVPGQNLFVSTVCSGPQSIDLKGIFENVNKYEYQDELGRTILETSKVVPHGVLCFFPSYSLMNKLQQRWSSTGLLEQLSELKEIFWEPRGKQEMNSVMADFTARIEMSTECPDEEIGAIMFGVYRGKIAEGIDFSDDNARVVIAVGIPYQNRHSNDISLKIKFNDENASGDLINGNRWYKIQAFRALNQALGRCIRHKNDWGAVILLDFRFSNKEVQDNLPSWIQQQLRNYKNWDTYISNVSAFCGRMKQTQEPK